MKWRTKRQLIITLIILAPFIIISALLFYHYTSGESCFDGKQNQDEEGVDCGGVCDKVCSNRVGVPSILWSRAFEVSGGVYNAVAMIENPNLSEEARDVPYTFTFYDEDNLPILERNGTFNLPPDRRVPIFEPSVISRERVPHRVTFQITQMPEWYRVEQKDIELQVSRQQLTEIESTPRLDATLINQSLFTLEDVFAVSILYDDAGNAVHTSRTKVEVLPAQSSADLVFTWPRPFDIEPGVCESPADIMLAIDRSGSMNNVSDDPPQPITHAKDAALSFVNELTRRDRVGLVTFATTVSDPIDHMLTDEKQSVRDTLAAITIRPEDEAGMTNIGDGITLAHEELTQNRRGNGSSKSVVVLLTDGRANTPEPDGEAYALERARLAKEAGIIFYTIGLGDDINEEFLTTIAGASERFYRAANSMQLTSIYQEVGTEICEKGPYVIEIIPLFDAQDALITS